MHYVVKITVVVFLMIPWNLDSHMLCMITYSFIVRRSSDASALHLATMKHQGCSQGVFFTEALAEFQHVNYMIVQIWDVKRVACYARAETFTEAVASVASMVATPLSTGTPSCTSTANNKSTLWL